MSVSVSAYTSVGQGSPANLTNLVTLSETREKILILVQIFYGFEALTINFPMY